MMLVLVFFSVADGDEGFGCWIPGNGYSDKKYMMKLSM